MTDYQEQARKNAERVTRTQNLRAMEHLIVGMGSKHAYVEWIKAMPENVRLSISGGLDHASMIMVSSDETAYNRAVKVFAMHMAPVLSALAEMEA